jgi:hypothetical protein
LWLLDAESRPQVRGYAQNGVAFSRVRATIHIVQDVVPSSDGLYRLDELGWLQFDRLSTLVLEAESGAPDVHWTGRSDAVRTAVVDEPLELSNLNLSFKGPVTVLAFWIPAWESMSDRLVELRRRFISLLDEPLGDELLVFTNLPDADLDVGLFDSVRETGRSVTVLDAAEISASLDRHPSLRAALPSVLGLRDLDGLIDTVLINRSSFDVGHAQELAQVFWPTRPYDRARAVLREHRFVVLTGPPEMGKTAIAEMLSLAQMTDGWEAHECTDPEQVWRVFDRDRRQVFVADDAFGSTEYKPDSAERWALALGRLLRMLDDDHWLIWTSRPAPLKTGLRRVQRERDSERFPSPGQVLVDASDLDLEEKTLILFRHAKAHGAAKEARRLVKMAGIIIVEHPHFTPERIRRFVTDRLDELPGQYGPEELELWRTIERELASPTEAMRTSFDALSPEHRDLLIAMLDTPAGLIDDRTLASTVRRHHPGGLSSPPDELTDRLTDHFLRVTSLGIGWVHPSWRDLVIDQLRADASARHRFLSAAGVDGLMLAVSRQGGRGGERALPLLETDADWDLLGDRLHQLLPELELRDLARIFLALETTLTELERSHEQAEAGGLAALLLDMTRRKWDREDRPLPAYALDAWYRLDHAAEADIQSPKLLTTWIEIHPGSLLLERIDRDELLRADEWLAIAQTLQQHDPEALEVLGFHARDRQVLVDLMVALTRATGTDEQPRGIAESVLRRTADLFPELAVDTEYAIQLGDIADQKWWAPSDIAVPPTTERVDIQMNFTRGDVSRVLSDL